MNSRTRKPSRPRIPPLPVYTVMTDRITGVRYTLSYILGSPDPTIVLVAGLPLTPDYAEYGPYDGPYASLGRRFYVSGGQLSLDYQPEAPISPQLYARVSAGDVNLLGRIDAPANGALTPITITLIQAQDVAT